MQYDNPAARLHEILTKGKLISGDTPCTTAWKQILKLDSDDPTLLQYKVGKVMALPIEINEIMRVLYPSRAKVPHWEHQIRVGFLNQSLIGKWSSFISSIDNHTVEYLALLADLIESKESLKILENEEITQLREKLLDIMDEVLSANLSLELKSSILRHLRKILEAIDDYNITGINPIIESVEATMGHAHLNGGFASFLKNEELGQKVLDFLSAASNILTVSTSLPQLSIAMAGVISVISNIN